MSSSNRTIIGKPFPGDTFLRVCKKCPQTIRFVGTAERKWMPCEPRKVDSLTCKPGDFLITLRGATVRVTEETPQFYGYRPHWPNCPGAEGFRKKEEE